jgi:sortase A
VIAPGNAPDDTPEKTVAVEPTPQAPIVPKKAIPDAYYEDDPQFEDEFYVAPKAPPSASEGKVWNRMLLVVELAAVLGLGYLFVGLFQTLQAASQASADIQSQYQSTMNARLVPPTPTPIINIADVVLPTGHIAKNGEASSAPNLDEVPAQYRAQYIALINAPQIIPTPNPEGPVRISISRMKVNTTVVSGDTPAALALGVGHHIGSANPGERGNMVLSAHDDIAGDLFKDLNLLQPGDSVVVSTMTKDYTYFVQTKQIVEPTDVWVMESKGDAKQLTLISCYPYMVDNKRIVVFATLQQS